MPPSTAVDESSAHDFDPVQLPPTSADTSLPSSSGAVQLSTPTIDTSLPKCSGDHRPPSLCPPLKRFDLYNGLLNEGCSLAPKAPAKEYQNKVELKILQHLGFKSRAELSDEEAKTLETKCKSFTNKARQLWASSKVRQIKGNMNKEKWLQENFEFGNLKPKKKPVKRKAPSPTVDTSLPRSSGAEPKKRKTREFEDLGRKAQEQETAEIRNNKREDAVVMAVKQILRKRNGHISADMFDRLVNEKDFGKTIKELMENQPVDVDLEEMCSFYLDQNMTRIRYNVLRDFLTKHKVGILPPYSHVQESSKKGLPECLSVSEFECSVPMRNLVAHCIKRIFEDKDIQEQAEILRAQQGDDEDLELDLLFDWGLDGTSGGAGAYTNLQSKKTYNELQEKMKSLLVTQMCVVQIKDKKSGKILFTNPLVSCATAHRIVRMAFEKESKESVKKEFARVQEQIDNLGSFEPMPNVKVTTTGFPALMDNKCKCIINNVGMKRCPVCGATQLETSVPIRKFKKRLKVLFGYSPLHYLLRNFEAVINLAAHNMFKKGFTYKGSVERQLRDKMLKVIQTALRKILRVRANEPRPGGNSNTGLLNFPNSSLLKTLFLYMQLKP